MRITPLIMGLLFILIALVGGVRGKTEPTLFQSGIKAYTDFYHWLRFPPVICDDLSTLSEYQVKQCKQYDEKRDLGILTLTIPFFFLGFSIWFALRLINNTYQSARTNIEEEDSKIIGKVVEHELPKMNLFNYFFGFKSVYVKGEKGKAIPVLLSHDFHTPRPGTRILVCHWKPPIGSKKFIGREHYPHLKIFRGIL